MSILSCFAFIESFIKSRSEGIQKPKATLKLNFLAAFKTL